MLSYQLPFFFFFKTNLHTEQIPAIGILNIIFIALSCNFCEYAVCSLNLFNINVPF